VKAAIPSHSSLHGIVLLLCVMAVLVCAAVPPGSNPQLVWFGLEVLIFGMLAVQVSGDLLLGRHGRRPGMQKVILGLMALWIACVFLQSVELPESTVRNLNPAVHDAQRDLALINVNAVSTLSIDSGRTFNEFLKYAACAAFFYLVLTLVSSSRRLLAVVGSLGLAAIVQALMVLYGDFADHEEAWALVSELSVNSGTVDQLGRSSSLLMMVLCVVLGVLVWRINCKSGADRWDPATYSRSEIAVVVAVLAAIASIVAAVLMAGNESSVLILVPAFAAVLILLRGDARSKDGERALGVAILSFAAPVFVHVFVSRDIDGVDPGSLVRYLKGLGTLSGVWKTGVGAGNYEWGFPVYGGGNFDFAAYGQGSNDYLRTVVEQGLALTVLLGAVVVLTLRELCKGYRNRRNPLVRGVVFGCLLGMVYTLMHSTIGLNFRSPSNVLYFFAIAAVGLAASRLDRQRRKITSLNHPEDEGKETV